MGPPFRKDAAASSEKAAASAKEAVAFRHEAGASWKDAVAFCQEVDASRKEAADSGQEAKAFSVLGRAEDIPDPCAFHLQSEALHVFVVVRVRRDDDVERARFGEDLLADEDVDLEALGREAVDDWLIARFVALAVGRTTRVASLGWAAPISPSREAIGPAARSD